jgi:hypothetical protein
MKKLTLLVLVQLTCAHLAFAGGVYITNNSSENVQIGTRTELDSHGKKGGKIGDPITIKSGEKLVSLAGRADGTGSEFTINDKKHTFQWDQGLAPHNPNVSYKTTGIKNTPLAIGAFVRVVTYKSIDLIVKRTDWDKIEIKVLPKNANDSNDSSNEDTKDEGIYLSNESPTGSVNVGPIFSLSPDGKDLKKISDGRTINANERKIRITTISTGTTLLTINNQPYIVKWPQKPTAYQKYRYAGPLEYIALDFYTAIEMDDHGGSGLNSVIKSANCPKGTSLMVYASGWYKAEFSFTRNSRYTTNV